MTLHTCRWAFRWHLIMARLQRQSFDPAYIKLSLGADECNVVRRRRTRSTELHQEMRVRLTESLAFRLEGRFWLTLIMEDKKQPKIPPVIVPYLNRRAAEAWVSIARLYQFNIYYQMQLQHAHKISDQQWVALENRRQQLFKQAALSQKIIDRDPVLQTLWHGFERKPVKNHTDIVYS